MEEMKKKTQLLTDNSWIRQRSGSSVCKEPVCVGVPLKRWVYTIFAKWDFHCTLCCCFVMRFCLTILLLFSELCRFLYRFESLDNLDTLRQSSLSSTMFTYPRPHSAAAGYCAPSRNSSSRYSTGAMLSQRTASMDPSHHGRYASPANIKCVLLVHVVVCYFLCLIIYFGLTLLTCAAPGWSVAGRLAVCVSVSWVVGQPWS